MHVSKRVLIQGEGELGEARYDMRGNCPALRLSRACFVRRLDVDMTGFREALKVEGGGRERRPARAGLPHQVRVLPGSYRVTRRGWKPLFPKRTLMYSHATSDCRRGMHTRTWALLSVMHRSIAQ